MFYDVAKIVCYDDLVQRLRIDGAFHWWRGKVAPDTPHTSGAPYPLDLIEAFSEIGRQFDSWIERTARGVEFVLLTDRGASTEFLVVYELPASEAFGQLPATVAEPGAPGFPAGQPAVFPIDGSATHLDFLTCQTADDGTHQVIATSAVLDKDQTEYRIQEVVFVLDPEADSYGQFVVVSSTSSAFAAIPTGASQPEPRGEPCWEPAPQSSPSSIP